MTTDPEYFEENAGSVEFWSPGSPLFAPPEFVADVHHALDVKTLKDILDS